VSGLVVSSFNGIYLMSAERFSIFILLPYLQSEVKKG
jgi:hypothetical protein